ncbi:hypothetical protein M5C72_10275 [Companilactobacillus allii]|uniref:Bacterial archaeo-eukaryotic release factor family 8 domain-containing protein n=1 Tax=Companilactobacillus allii TaxID=1847728 RepID=A0A1P8PZZ5_9LACO|nr:hypothetical protein [Companilactobacillus allii]APX71147.1 hypothetical protein BTM29_00645 [Companilactobacillus allii]USQ68228.1 hypothetical protein M5C72_10275 [Companilactobacillus allii]
MKLTNKKELLNLLSSKVEPKISIILPIHPETPQVNNNILIYKNLLKDVKKDLELNYPRRDWSNAVEKLDALILDRTLWSNAGPAVLIFATNDDVQICEMNHDVEPKSHVGNTFLIQDLFLQEELTDAPQYIINISRDRINIVDVKTLKAINTEKIYTKFADYYSDFDVDSNLNTGSYGGLNTSNYHGHRSKPEEQEKDQLIYYRYLNRELTKLSKENGYSFIISGLPEVLDTYLNNYGNSSYIYDVIRGSVLNLSQNELKNKLNQLSVDKRMHNAELLQQEYNQADRQDKVLSDVDSINHAITDKRVKSIISFNIGNSYSIDQNKLMLKAALNKINCRVLNANELTDLPNISAIVY